MTETEIMTLVLDEIDIQDRSKIERAITSTLERVNTQFDGLREFIAVMEDGIMASGYSYADNILSYPSTIVKSLMNVFVDNVKIPRRTFDEIKAGNVVGYCVISPNEIEFWEAVTTDMTLDCLIAIPDIGNLPSEYNNGFVSGVLSKLNRRPDVNNEDMFKYHEGIFIDMLSKLDNIESARYVFEKQLPTYFTR